MRRTSAFRPDSDLRNPFVTLAGVCASLAALFALCTSALADAPLPPPMAAQRAFEDLRTNARVAWLVRLVPYDPADPVLAIDRLTHLGGPREEFTFVADYAELRGYTAEQAARLGGGVIEPGQHISGIIFPLPDVPLYPASVRGMLQVIQELDKKHADDDAYRPARLEQRLSPAELANLADGKRASWAWDNYRQHLGSFARVFGDLRRENVSAFDRIGHIGGDWCEPGCSRLLGHATALRPETMTLELPDGAPLEIKRFGIRVFLIRNLPISALYGRILIDFNKPAEQIVPWFPLPGDEAK